MVWRRLFGWRRMTAVRAVRDRMMKVRFGELLALVGGGEAAAGFCRVGKSVLSTYASLAPADADRFAPIDVVRDLEAIAGEPIVTAQLAMEAGGAFVTVPSSAADGGNLLTLLAGQSRESSELTTAICLGLADGKLTADEVQPARDAVRQLVQLAMQMDAELAMIGGEES